MLELLNADDAPGIKSGGVLEQVTRELNIEALPNEIPDTIELDVSTVEIGDTVTLRAVTAPDGVALLDDLEETVVATRHAAPKLSVESSDEIETETEVVGEATTTPPRASSEAASSRHAPAGGRRGRVAGRLAVVGLGNPGSQYAGDARTTSASRSPTCSPRAGSCRARRRSIRRARDRRARPGPEARTSRSCCRRRT